MDDDVTTYTCTVCGENLPVDAFYPYDTKRCRECKNLISGVYSNNATRKCSGCGQEKPYRSFPSKTRRKDCVDRLCHECLRTNKDKDEKAKQAAIRAERERRQRKEEEAARARELRQARREAVKKSAPEDIPPPTSGSLELQEVSQRSRFWRGHGRPVSPQYDASRERRLRRLKSLVLYFNTHPCVKCGEADPLVLDFHHRDPETKLFGIKDNLTTTLERLSAEVAKCDVLCSNCHRKREAASDPRRLLPVAIDEVAQGLLEDVPIITGEGPPVENKRNIFTPPPGLFD